MLPPCLVIAIRGAGTMPVLSCAGGSRSRYYARPRPANRMLTTRLVVSEALPRFGITAIGADEVASILTFFWYGMEVRHLLGVPEPEGHLWRTLETLGELIERLENAARSSRAHSTHTECLNHHHGFDRAVFRTH